MAKVTLIGGVVPTAKHYGLVFARQNIGIQTTLPTRITVDTYRALGIPLQPLTPAQNATQLAVAVAASQWANLTALEQSIWNSYAATPQTGYNLFIQQVALEYSLVPNYYVGYPGRYNGSDGVFIGAGTDSATGDDFFGVSPGITVDATNGYVVGVWVRFSSFNPSVDLAFSPPNRVEFVSGPAKTSGYVQIGSLGPFFTQAALLIWMSDVLRNLIGFIPAPIVFDPVALTLSGGRFDWLTYQCDRFGKFYAGTPILDGGGPLIQSFTGVNAWWSSIAEFASFFPVYTVVPFSAGAWVPARR